MGRQVVPFCSRSRVWQNKAVLGTWLAWVLSLLPRVLFPYLPGTISQPLSALPLPPGVLLPSSNLLKDRLLRAVLCPDFPFDLLSPQIPKPPIQSVRPPAPPSSPLKPNSRVDSSLTDQLLLFRHPEHSPPPTPTIVRLTSLKAPGAWPCQIVNRQIPVTNPARILLLPRNHYTLALCVRVFVCVTATAAL